MIAKLAAAKFQMEIISRNVRFTIAHLFKSNHILACFHFAFSLSLSLFPCPRSQIFTLSSTDSTCRQLGISTNLPTNFFKFRTRPKISAFFIFTIFFETKLLVLDSLWDTMSRLITIGGDVDTVGQRSHIAVMTAVWLFPPFSLYPHQF